MGTNKRNWGERMSGARKIKPKKFRKPCRLCNKLFRPIGNSEKLCSKCYYEVQRKNVRNKISKRAGRNR